MRRLLERLLHAARRAADPGAAVRRALTRSGNSLRVGPARDDLTRYKRVWVVGVGKAAGGMALALERIVGDRLAGGLAVVERGQAVRTGAIPVVQAGHPTPDQAGLRAARRVQAILRAAGPRDLVIVLLSGGASSLLPSPADGLTLADKRRTTRLLLRSGATIGELNCVRKHLSSLKGGRLAAQTKAAVLSLVLSDVIGDDLSVIASGPTAPDPTTYGEACAVVQRYGLWSSIPRAVRTHLLAGKRNRRAETPKPGDPIFRRVRNVLLSIRPRVARAVAAAARGAGFHATVLSTDWIGEAREAAKTFGTLARAVAATGRPVPRPACIVAMGELTVTVRGRGAGGRAQELALAAACEIAGLRDVWIAAVGTDGRDGPTDVAGAVASGTTAARARRRGLDPQRMLARNDSYRFFQAVGGHIRTGPTGANANDLYLLIVR
jgi:glycerate-2-kinase